MRRLASDVRRSTLLALPRLDNLLFRLPNDNVGRLGFAAVPKRLEELVHLGCHRMGPT